MRVSPFALWLAGSQLANAWSVNLFSGKNCYDDDKYEYYSIQGEGSMPFCDAPHPEMQGVTTCAYINNNGKGDPEVCDRQFKRWHSAKIIRGEMEMWASYDDHPHQPDNMRCRGAQGSNCSNTVFRASDKCINYFAHNADGFEGILARESSPPKEADN